MGRSWIGRNLAYIQAVNMDDRPALNRFFDEACDDPTFFTRKRYVWNIIRGKEFCRIVAEWVIDWYRALASADVARSKDAEANVINLLHRIMVTETHENIKRSLVWKITKYAPVLTIDTLPYISRERLQNILDSDHWIMCDEALEPVVMYCSKLKVDMANEKAAMNAMSGLINP